MGCGRLGPPSSGAAACVVWSTTASGSVGAPDGELGASAEVDTSGAATPSSGFDVGAGDGGSGGSASPGNSGTSGKPGTSGSAGTSGTGSTSETSGRSSRPPSTTG